MGKKGSWFGSVKKAFSPESKKSSKSKKKWGFGSQKHGEDPAFASIETAPAALVAIVPPPPPPAPPTPPPLPPQPDEVKVMEAQNEQSKQAYTVAVATAAAAEAAVAAAQAAAQVVRLTNLNNYPGKSMEEVAAIKIQTAFRGYLARRALRALRGLDRLKTLIEGQSVRRQATTTLKCMQTLARLQSQIRARRIRMSEENQALQRQLQQNRERDLENLRASMGDDWDDSIQSKEQVEASLLSKHEATIRRERAMAYAYSHQQSWKNSRPGNTLFMDPQNPHWGWSWLERWMAARPWESRSTTEKELNDHSSVKGASLSTVGGEITKSYAASHEPKVEKPSPTVKKPFRQSPSTPSYKVLLPSSLPAGKLKSASPKAMHVADDDSGSIMSIQSERPRRHSIAGSSVRDDESLASSPAVPSYMAPTESARAKARLQSPLGFEKAETPDKGLSGSVKKRLSFSASSATRRHSGPPKIESQLIKDIGVKDTELSVSNGSGGGGDGGSQQCH